MGRAAEMEFRPGLGLNAIQARPGFCAAAEFNRQIRTSHKMHLMAHEGSRAIRRREPVRAGQVYLLASSQLQHWLLVVQELGVRGLWACCDLKSETTVILGSESLERLCPIHD